MPLVMVHIKACYPWIVCSMKDAMTSAMGHSNGYPTAKNAPIIHIPWTFVFLQWYAPWCMRSHVLCPMARNVEYPQDYTSYHGAITFTMVAWCMLHGALHSPYNMIWHLLWSIP